MGTVTAHIPGDLEATFEAYLEAKQLDRGAAVRKLLTEGLTRWRREHALDRLEAGEVSVSRAAEIAEMNAWEFARLAKEDGVTWVGEQAGADLDHL